MPPFSFWLCVGFASSLLLQIDLATACLQDERSSLLDFKEGLTDYSGRLSSWQGDNCCQWRGVHCDSRSSHVIRLDLRNHDRSSDGELSGLKNLRGTIRPSLFNLQHLQHLDLSYNYFNGSPIPPQVGNLKNLTFLSLSDAEFEGEIPMELGNITTLRHLDISASYSAGLNSSRFAEWVRNLRSLEYLAMKDVNISKASEHWGNAFNNLSKLREIYLSGCGLSGRIPSLLNLTHLSHLHLSDNSFPFPLPSWFENVSSLVSLDLSYCSLEGFIPSNFLHRSSLSNIELSFNSHLRGNLSFIINHSSSLRVLSLQARYPYEGWSPDEGGVEGVIPPSIANFSKLEKLNLACNNLTGDIPQFGHPPGALFHLSKIDLSYNHLNGSIPSSLGSLSSLRYLELSHNQLQGTIPDTISKLIQLERLSLSSNDLSSKDAIFLSLFDNLTHLEVLDLSANSLRLNISSSWVPQFAHLKHLAMRSCNIHGDFPAFLSTQYSLKALDLSDNRIAGNIPTWLWDLPNLFALNLSNNILEGQVPQVRSHSLAVVDLHGNGLQGSVPVFNPPLRWILDLSENHFNGPIPSATIGYETVYISLSGNNLTGRIPDIFCAENYPNLSFLDLSNNSLTGTIPPNLGRCSWLGILNLNTNHLQGEIPQELGKLTALRSLDLNANNLQGAIPSSLANCKDLTILDLGNNKIEGHIPVWIEELRQLQIFSLTANKFQSRIPPGLFTMQNLQILDLSRNNLSGQIPEKLSNLTAMVNRSTGNDIGHSGTFGFVFEAWSAQIEDVEKVTLWIKGRSTTYMKIFGGFKFMDLSHNQLSGNIPQQMGLLRGLINLNISRNNLNGSIPDSLGAMTEMESLDLSSNKLSGEIPLQLLDLTFLEVLNLSNNMLSGIIPQGRQFSTFEASSFAGNPDLRGFPLENRTVKNRSEEGNNDKYKKREEEADEEEGWWVVSIGIGFGIGFDLVIAFTCFHIEWRNKYFAVLDGLVLSLCQR